MKNYFNSAEQVNHLIIMSATVMAKKLLESNAPTEEEKRFLKKIVEYVDKFSESVFARMGNEYMRSLKNKAQLNELKLMSKNAFVERNTKMEDYIDRDILCLYLDQMADIDCINCEKTNCTQCPIYRIKTYLTYDGKAEDNDLCPYRKEEKLFEDFEELEKAI